MIVTIIVINLFNLSHPDAIKRISFRVVNLAYTIKTVKYYTMHHVISIHCQASCTACDDPGWRRMHMFQIFGRDVEATAAIVGYGLHPWGGSRLTDEFY